METSELIKLIAQGEDSSHQFKVDVTNPISLAQEFTALSNSRGGQIFIGVTDDGEVTGLTTDDIARLNQLVSNAASQHVHPPVNPITENVDHPDGLVMVVTVVEGISKPYMDNEGAVWLKSGADKRKATSREEIQRMFQSASLIHGDDVPVAGMTVEDFDLVLFRRFYEKEFGENLDEQELSLSQIAENLNLTNEGVLNVAGALLFAEKPERRLPAFIVKCVCYPGNDIHVSEYLDSEDITGPLESVFKRTKSFLLRNIFHIQGDQDVNAAGQPEIPQVTIEELITNALIHRDYFISAPIRIFIFSDRIEIITPGHLPNSLTIENIKSGNSNIRNPILASFATKMLPYRGLGNGIRRALKAYPYIDFENDREGCLFKAIIKRKPF